MADCNKEEIEFQILPDGMLWEIHRNMDLDARSGEFPFFDFEFNVDLDDANTPIEP